MVDRKPPTPTVVKRLFALSSNCCAFPDCSNPIVHGESVVGQICHIKAEKPKGPRFDMNQSDEERRAYENLILLCRNHHKIIDDDENTYTVEVLNEYKSHHESGHTVTAELNDNQIASLIQTALEEIVSGIDMISQTQGQNSQKLDINSQKLDIIIAGNKEAKLISRMQEVEASDPFWSYERTVNSHGDILSFEARPKKDSPNVIPLLSLNTNQEGIKKINKAFNEGREIELDPSDYDIDFHSLDPSKIIYMLDETDSFSHIGAIKLSPSNNYDSDSVSIESLDRDGRVLDRVVTTFQWLRKGKSESEGIIGGGAFLCELSLTIIRDEQYTSKLKVEKLDFANKKPLKISRSIELLKSIFVDQNATITLHGEEDFILYSPGVASVIEDESANTYFHNLSNLENLLSALDIIDGFCSQSIVFPGQYDEYFESTSLRLAKILSCGVVETHDSQNFTYSMSEENYKIFTAHIKKGDSIGLIILQENQSINFLGEHIDLGDCLTYAPSISIISSKKYVDNKSYENDIEICFQYDFIEYFYLNFIPDEVKIEIEAQHSNIFTAKFAFILNLAQKETSHCENL